MVPKKLYAFLPIQLNCIQTTLLIIRLLRIIVGIQLFYNNAHNSIFLRKISRNGKYGFGLIPRKAFGYNCIRIFKAWM